MIAIISISTIIVDLGFIGKIVCVCCGGSFFYGNEIFVGLPDFEKKRYTVPQMCLQAYTVLNNVLNCIPLK